MRIALFTDGVFPYVIGGMQKHSYYLARYFAKNKIHVDLYHTSSDITRANTLDCFTPEEREYLSSFVFEFPRLDNMPGHYIREMYAYSKLLFLKLQENPPVDFIYVQGLCGMKLFENRSQINTPVGVNFHGLEMFQKTANLRSKLEQYLFKRPVLKSLKKADVIFSLGGELSRIMIKEGIPEQKVIEIPIGIDSSWLSSEPRNLNDQIKLVFIGRYERRKGVEELTRVLSKIPGDMYHFSFIGAIPDEKKLKIPSVNYYGVISDPEKIKSILRDSDILVCPSYSEGMPTVILEAMASGMAIIASNVGAVSEQVDDSNGILIQPGNETELKSALLKMITIDKDELNKMKKNSISKIKSRFLWDEVISLNISEIRKICGI